MRQDLGGRVEAEAVPAGGQVVRPAPPGRMRRELHVRARRSARRRPRGRAHPPASRSRRPPSGGGPASPARIRIRSPILVAMAVDAGLRQCPAPARGRSRRRRSGRPSAPPSPSSAEPSSQHEPQQRGVEWPALVCTKASAAANRALDNASSRAGSLARRSMPHHREPDEQTRNLCYEYVAGRTLPGLVACIARWGRMPLPRYGGRSQAGGRGGGGYVGLRTAKEGPPTRSPTPSTSAPTPRRPPSARWGAAARSGRAPKRPAAP